MPFVRVVKAWVTETVEIEWQRPRDPGQLASPSIESLVERHTVPPEEVWKARKAQEGARGT
jgi:hypothetical protein